MRTEARGFGICGISLWIRQQENDGVGAPIEDPVGLPREEEGVEDHKGSVEVCGRQGAYHQEDGGMIWR